MADDRDKLADEIRNVDEIDEVPTDIETLGAALRYLRERRGMTLRALARAVGVSAPFLSDVEHNRRRTDKLREIAKILNVPLAQLQALDGRLPQDLKDWISTTPGLVALLKEMKASGESVEHLRTRFATGRTPRRASR